MHRMNRYILLFLLVCGISAMFCVQKAQAYVLGMKSSDNSVENIMSVESAAGHDIQLVSFILDPFLGKESLIPYQKNIAYLSGKILHFTISPNKLTAKQVAEGRFDAQYNDFFDFVKTNNLKVVFRTMHEMNGNRYPWAGSTQQFKKAWTRVRKLSRAK